jgi:hypothetical protein
LRESEDAQKHQRHDPTKIAMPQNLCVTTRSSLSLKVSAGAPATVATRWWMAAMRA